jgi:hypothetical protein
MAVAAPPGGVITSAREQSLHLLMSDKLKANNFAPPPRQKAHQGSTLGTSKSQMQLNAEQKLRTIAKLVKDDMAMSRKALHLAHKADDRKSANDLKAYRVAEHNRKVASDREARFQQLAEAEEARRSLLNYQEELERARLESAGEELRSLIDGANCHVQRARQANEERIRKKIEEDEEKLKRKAQHLQSIADSRHEANLQKSEKVVEHRMQTLELQEERMRRMQMAEEARASAIRQRDVSERQRLELAGTLKRSILEEAARARQEMREALERRVAEKQAKDSEKLLKKYNQLENTSSRLQKQNQVREERIQRKKCYDELVERASAMALLM